MSHTYFSDREYGSRARTEQGFGPAAWGGVIALVRRLINNGSFGLDFPEQCQDGHGTIGTDYDVFRLTLDAEIPGLEDPLDPDQIPSVPSIMDLLEFCYFHVVQPNQCSYHSYFSHHHLSFDQEQGQATFREEVNRLLARNGLAYELQDDGRAIRLAPPVLREVLASTVFNTGDSELDVMLESARTKFLNPDEQVRRESLEKLWDAWERLKTVEPGKDKKESIGRLLDLAATEQTFRDALETEANELTKIGNIFLIRHSETSQVPITRREHVDYLFHRLFALIVLVLRMREGSQ